MPDKIIFLDRDGVINKKAPEHDYIKKWEEFKFLPNVDTAIKLFNEAGFKVILITNQRGIARGIMSMDDLHIIHKKMCKELALKKAKIDDIFVCPHDEGECNCRKPKPGMFLEAVAKFDIDVSKSAMIGDHAGDLIAAKAAGVSRLFLVGNHIQTEKIKVPDCICCASVSECLKYF